MNMKKKTRVSIKLVDPVTNSQTPDLWLFGNTQIRVRINMSLIELCKILASSARIVKQVTEN